jgi:hypothetical protein
MIERKRIQLYGLGGENMKNPFVRTDPIELEYQRLLEHEVDQQLKMEDLVRKHALISDSGEAIIFLVPSNN